MIIVLIQLLIPLKNFLKKTGLKISKLLKAQNCLRIGVVKSGL